MLITFLWTMIFCFTFFQYFREKHFKSELVNAQLQLYNHKLLTLVEDGSPYEDFIASEEKPFDDLRISIIATTGTVIFDNTLSVDSLDNHSHRPEVIATMKNGDAYHAGRQSTSDGRDYFYSATRGDRVIVRTAIPYSDILKELLRPDSTFIFVMICISIAMSVLVFFATRRLGENIERLNRFAAKAETGESFDDGSEFFIWISDDRNKIPIFFESPIRVGSVRAYISSYEGLRYPLESKVD